MITSIFLFIIGSFVAVLTSVLGAVGSFVPQNIQNSFSYVFGLLGYFNGIMNWTDILAAVSWFLVFVSAWFTFLTLMWFWHKMPFVGKENKA